MKKVVILLISIYSMTSSFCNGTSNEFQLMISSDHPDKNCACNSVHDFNTAEIKKELNAIDNLIQESGVDMPNLDLKMCKAARTSLQTEPKPDSKCSIITCEKKEDGNGSKFKGDYAEVDVCATRSYWFQCPPNRPNLAANPSIVHFTYRSFGNKLHDSETTSKTKREAPESLVVGCPWH